METELLSAARDLEQLLAEHVHTHRTPAIESQIRDVENSLALSYETMGQLFELYKNEPPTTDEVDDFTALLADFAWHNEVVELPSNTLALHMLATVAGWKSRVQANEQPKKKQKLGGAADCSTCREWNVRCVHTCLL